MLYAGNAHTDDPSQRNGEQIMRVFDQNTGVAPISGSRIVPPPMDVTAANTSTPIISIFKRPATNTPEKAKPRFLTGR